MTSYSAMADRGREEARARTAGHRKPVVARCDWSETPDPEMPNSCSITEAALIGKCGHVLERQRWRRSIEVANWRLDAMRRKVGRRMTCQDDDCRIATATLSKRSS